MLWCVQAGVMPPFPDLRLSLTKMEDEGMGKGKMQAGFCSVFKPPDLASDRMTGFRVAGFSCCQNPQHNLHFSQRPLNRFPRP